MYACFAMASSAFAQASGRPMLSLTSMGLLSHKISLQSALFRKALSLSFLLLFVLFYVVLLCFFFGEHTERYECRHRFPLDFKLCTDFPAASFNERFEPLQRKKILFCIRTAFSFSSNAISFLLVLFSKYGYLVSTMPILIKQCGDESKGYKIIPKILSLLNP